MNIILIYLSNMIEINKNIILRVLRHDNHTTTMECIIKTIDNDIHKPKI